MITRTTDPSLLRDETLVEIFKATALACPARPAATFEGLTVTYQDLDRRSDLMAMALAEWGIGRGNFVGLWMERSLDLHVALLAILKAGAAYLPFDADAPAERVAACLADCQAKALIADIATILRSGEQPVPVLDFAGLARRVADVPLPDPRALGMEPADPAYIIYTSGSTGQPKGVVISHRNICHYLRAANTVYGVSADDVMYQGASVAFDLSLEEIFLPYLTGCSMWIAPRRLLQDADRLAETLDLAGITVMSAVPTLLGLMSSDVPGLRLIILGGEACPPSLADRWCRPGRRVLNSYGPTETTVVATVSEVLPGQPITIGTPLPNYSCYVVDDALRLVPQGVEGELLIGGPGVAAGYLNRPQLSAEKFISNPFADNSLAPILYRSGDAVCVDDCGQLLFRGRIDDQVKIRGYRIELGEIEARLSQWPGVRQAAVVVTAEGGTERLVAFILADAGGAPDLAGLRQALGRQMPCYMVPGHFELVSELPRLTSGKVDRKALQRLPLTAASVEEQELPATPTEAALLEAAQKVFPGQAIPFDADFFMDLGGHSLIAARFVSAVRAHAKYARLTMQEVYARRSLRLMAAGLDQQAIDQPPQPQSLAFDAPPLLRRFLCGLAQAAVLPLILALTTAPWLGVFVAYECFSGEEHNFLAEISALLTTYAVINAALVLVAIAGKWLAIGRTRPGRYPLWGVYYFRWWLAQRFTGMVHYKWFQGTPIMRLVVRGLGARVGAEAMICELEAGAVDLIDIGDGATIGGKANFANAEVIGDELVIGRVVIGATAQIGASCVIRGDVIVGEGAELGDLAALAAGSRVGPWEVWDGSPATRTGMVDRDALPTPAKASALRKAALGGLYALMLVILPPLALIPIIPAFYLYDSLADMVGALVTVSPLYFLPVLAWATAMVLILVTVLLIAMIRWIVLPKVKPGVYSVYSGFFLRKWIVALATELTLETLSSLYATVYMRNWYRLMGAKIGRDSEISTNLSGRYDLTEIGEKCFIADEVVLGDEDIRRGWLYLKPVKTEDRVFVGNDAVVPPGTIIPSGTLIGIKSRPPATNGEMTAGDTWFGSPPFRMPLRQRFDDIPADWTYEPSRWRRIGRATFEAFSVSLPSMLSITLGILAVEFLAPSILDRDYATLIPLFITVSVALSLILAVSAAGVKWLLMGTYRPTVKPMWSWWAMRTEAVAVLYWGLAAKILFESLRGTPFMSPVLRLFGTKVGQGVFIDSSDLTEFDCVTIGDFCAINSYAALQTHLYEDRVMKVGRVVLGKGVTVGVGSTVLYDTIVGDFARIGPLTVIMKGEEIPASTEWCGAPARSMVSGSVAASGSPVVSKAAAAPAPAV